MPTSRARPFSILATVILGLLVLAVVLLARRHAAQPPAAPAAASLSGAPPAPARHAVRRPTPFPEDDDPAGGESLAARRLARAQYTLDSYRHATRYPPESQPMRDNPDMERPHWVPRVTYPLAQPDGETTEAQVVLRQDRRFLTGNEKARLSLRCQDREGNPLPCTVLSAAAGPLDSPRFVDLPTAVPLTFVPEEQEWLSTTLQPATQGFAGYFGLLRVGVRVRAGDEEGTTGFQLEYTPSPPATFTGKVDERLERGSLVLRVGMQVARPGRYVLRARVEDATGKLFAFLSFNDELPAGAQAARLLLFGKLMLDEQPQQPCRLRDLEGFRLLEDTSPDRELMPALEGEVHTLAVYPESAFSPDEWQSEERTRHLDEFTRDVEALTREVEVEKL